MRLFILGATGLTGRQLVAQAIAQGHAVTAFVRAPEKLALAPGLAVRRGDPRDGAALGAALGGHDAVLSALGPPGPARSTLLRDSARSIVDAMQATSVSRLLVVSAAVLFEDAGAFVTLMRRTLLRNIAEDNAAMERCIAASALDWTIARPPRLTNGRMTGNYRVAEDHLPRRGFLVSRADVAHFLLGALERGAHRRKIVGVAR
ncbi:MAG: NAD(P)H-binding protein [Alphaproteobacteria bacterium]|nr:NAD(P)H-binding protein [Alphaproteobacteria bacterium]